jgi:hypothetical protein
MISPGGAEAGKSAGRPYVLLCDINAHSMRIASF